MTHKTDEEQIEDLKHWWEQNGKYVIVAVLLLISGIVGGRVWLDYTHSTVENASAQYEQMIAQMQAGKMDDAERIGSELIEKHSDLPYATMAAFSVAKIQIDKNDLNAAKQQLLWAIDHADNDSLKHIAQLRLARVLLAADQLDEALKYATPSNAGAFGDAYSMVKGDIFLKKGDLALARTSYESALTSRTMSQQLRAMVQMKLDDIAAPNKEAAL